MYKFNNDKPIYSQIAEIIKFKIASGNYAPGEKLPSVRDYSIELGVNPNTVQKSFSELERDELIITNRTSGRTVTDKKDTISNLRSSIANQKLCEIIKTFLDLGYTKEQILQFVDKYLKEM